jgi:xanthine dehydrogenase/oxidase
VRSLHRETPPLNFYISFVAKALGIPRNRVIVKVKRVGGGFGGKETRSVFISCIAGIGAVISRRQV